MDAIQKFEKDLQWYSDNYQQITKEHSEEFVAIKNGNIIDSGKDPKKIIGRLKKRRINPAHTLIWFVSKSKFVLWPKSLSS